MTAGRVTVNGRRVTTLGTKIDPTRATVAVNGELVSPRPFVYYAVHKPVGMVSARTTPRREPVVTELVPSDPPVVPVGRLDKRSTGLMILTNDGAFAYQVTHPKFIHEKEYEVVVRAPNSEALGGALERLAGGVRVLRERLAFDQVMVVTTNGATADLRVVLHTGKKRQIRRMAAAVGLAVDRLHRIRIGQLRLGSLKPGQWRAIVPSDVIRALPESEPPVEAISNSAEPASFLVGDEQSD